MTITETPTHDLLTLLAVSAVKAKDAKKFAEEAYKVAEADMVEAMLAAGETSLMLADDTRVTVEGLTEVRRTIDITALMDLVPASVFAKVIKESIDLAKFDAAVTAGFIAAEVADKVTETKPVKPSLRITAKAKK